MTTHTGRTRRVDEKPARDYFAAARARTAAAQTAPGGVFSGAAWLEGLDILHHEALVEDAYRAYAEDTYRNVKAMIEGDRESLAEAIRRGERVNAHRLVDNLIDNQRWLQDLAGQCGNCGMPRGTNADTGCDECAYLPTGPAVVTEKGAAKIEATAARNASAESSPEPERQPQAIVAPRRHKFVSVPGVNNCARSDDDGHWCNRDESDPVHFPTPVASRTQAIVAPQLNRITGRQFCRKGMHPCTPALTLVFTDDGITTRLHWCEEHTFFANPYRADASEVIDHRAAADA